jgi:hypothetical protein
MVEHHWTTTARTCREWAHSEAGQAMAGLGRFLAEVHTGPALAARAEWRTTTHHMRQAMSWLMRAERDAELESQFNALKRALSNTGEST